MNIVTFGQILVGLGFLIASGASVTHATDVVWVYYGAGLVIGIVGIVMAQTGIRRMALAADALASNIEAISSSLKELASRAESLDGNKEEVFVYDLHGKIDELFPQQLEIFVDARESVIHAHGMQAYADLMNHFAAAERSINRVWSASVDGYIDECHLYITKAANHFRDADTVFSNLQAKA